MKRYSLALGALVLFAVASWFLFGPNGTDTVIAADEVASSSDKGFSIATIDGKTFDLTSHNGEVVIVNFWATWCPPCRQEIPHFVELYSELDSDKFEIIGISVDRGGQSTVDEWLAANPVNYPIAMGADGALFEKYQQLIDPSQRGGIPFTVIFDKSGNVAHKIVGYQDKAQWLEMVQPLM